VTQVAAQIASEFIGQRTGGAAESSNPNGTTTSTPSSSPTATSDSDQGLRLGLAALHFSGVASLVQQILNALNESHFEPRKIHEHLPLLFSRVRDEVGEELRDERARKHAQSEEPVKQAQEPLSMNAAVALAYETVRKSSASLSLHG